MTSLLIIFIGTYDIQNISVSSPSPGEVRVTGDFIDGSTATGLLVIIYSLNNESDVHYHNVSRTSHEQRFEDHFTALYGDRYNISVFVLDEVGQLFTTAAANPKNVSVVSDKAGEK